MSLVYLFNGGSPVELCLSPHKRRTGRNMIKRASSFLIQVEEKGCSPPHGLWHFITCKKYVPAGKGHKNYRGQLKINKIKVKIKQKSKIKIVKNTHESNKEHRKICSDIPHNQAGDLNDLTKGQNSCYIRHMINDHLFL